MTGAAVTPGWAAMITSQKARAAANRQRIAQALVTMQRDGKQITLRSLAQQARVHPDTIRRNPDLLQEFRHVRDQGWQPTGPAVAGSGQRRAGEAALKVRLLDGQAEISELRRQLAQALRSAHNDLGHGGTMVSAAEAEQLRQELTELRVQLMAAQEQLARERELHESILGELTAANEVNRQLVRDLTAAKENELLMRQRLNARRK